MKQTFLAFVFSAVSMLASDVTGIWSGSFVMTRDGETKNSTAHLILKQDGSRITGSAGPNSDEQHPITTGSIEGNQIKLAVEKGPDSTETILFKLTVEGDRIVGEARAEEEGRVLTAKIDVKREK